ncbi:MAG: Fe-S cluster assembly protein SufD [Pseudomonadota bacterium]
MNAQVKSLLSAARLPQTLPGARAAWLWQARQAALERFAARGLPTTRDEEWKYTDVAAVGKRASLAPERVGTDEKASVVALEFAQECALPQPGARRLVFVNGYYEPALSAAGTLPDGVRLGSLAQTLGAGDDDLSAFFAPAAEHTVFANLNTAFATDGAVLHLTPGTAVDAPIYLLFIATAEAGAIYPRNLIVAEEGSRATVIEHYAGYAGARNFTVAVTQIAVGAGAVLDHYKLLQEGGAALHIAGVHAEQKAGSRFASHSFALGGRLQRNDITVRLAETGCACILNGLYLAADRQLVDHHTRIDHLAPGCSSREYYRGVLDGAARGVFNGKVVVQPGAQKTDAYQANHNLLLSRQAEIDTKPQLEIFADDVKCTHGATVGQLDEDALFYLRCRGIDAELARSMLIHGFANDIIGRVEVPALRAKLEQLLVARLPQGENIEELS